MFSCELCGFEAKSKGGLKAHQRLKHSVQDVEPVLLEASESIGSDLPVEWPRGVSAPGQPAIIPEWNEQIGPLKVTVIGREITMLRPICDLCQRPKRTQPGWWLKCPHNPYAQIVPVRSKNTVYETLPDGRRRVKGIEEFETLEERPNRVQVSAWRRINSGVLVERKRRRNGFILPSELRTEMFPFGVANTCEFRDCFVQENLISTRWGNFCRKIEAQLVGHDARMDGGGGALEVGDTQQSQEKQAMQLEQVPL